MREKTRPPFGIYLWLFTAKNSPSCLWFFLSLRITDAGRGASAADFFEVRNETRYD